MMGRLPCTVEDCDSPRHARQLCNRHYKRLREHGDVNKCQANDARLNPEIDRFLSMLASYHGIDCVIWPYGKNSAGYAMVTLDHKRVLVHRHVCELRNGPPPSPSHHARHLCGHGNLGCVNPSHLDWGTATDNSRDKERHGTVVHGEACYNAKLNETAVREIRHSRQSMASLARRFGVSSSTIQNIRARRSWARVSDKPKGKVA